ncbi:MAG: hypothetical protein WC538_14885 [Thermoanaerobaculia bacterium]
MSPSKRDVLLILAIHLIAGFLFLSPSYIRPDSVGVMSWLRSAAIDHDFLFFDEWAGFGMIGNGFAWFKEVTPAGALANHWWVGTSILSAPFWGVSHLVSIALPGKLFPDDGFFGLDLVTLGWTSVLFGAIALILASKVLRETDAALPERDLLLTLALTILGSPLFWYLFRMPIGTHAAGAMMVAALTWLCWRLVSGRDDVSPLLVGLVFGLAVVTRLQHALLLPAILFAGVRSRRSPRFYLLFAAGAAIPAAVQGAAWHAIYGTPLGPLARGANLEGVTWMPFRHVDLLSVLASPWHGLLTWSPVVLVAIAGWVALHRQGGTSRDLAIVLSLMFAGELIANSALDRYWWGGMSFGARRFVDLAAPFAIGIGAAIRARARVGAIMAGTASTLWSVALMLAATCGSLSLSRYLSAGDLLIAVGATPRSIAFDQLRSPVASGAILTLSLVALAVVAILAAIWFALARRLHVTPAHGLLALSAAALVATLLLIAPTRQRAARERASHGLDGIAARSAGALIDQRGLLQDEAAWLLATGRSARLESTRHEIEAIGARLRELGVE